MRDKYFYLDFHIGSIQRLKALSHFFTALKVEKERIFNSETVNAEGESYDLAADPKWLNFLDSEAKQWFANTFDYNSEEGKTYQKLWNLTEPKVRLSHPMFCPPGNWDFESMLDALFNGEYVLIDLVKESETQGVLYYNPLAGPFGGSEALVELVESFGQTVTFDSWHKGPPHRQVIGWDYALARQLVLRNKGFCHDGG